MATASDRIRLARRRLRLSARDGISIVDRIIELVLDDIAVGYARALSDAVSLSQPNRIENRKRLRDQIEKFFVILSLIGRASQSRDLRRQGLIGPVPEQERITDGDVRDAGVRTFAAAVPPDLVRMPFSMAINVFLGDIPDLRDVVTNLQHRASVVSSRLIDPTPSAALDLAERVIRQTTRVGDLGGVGVSPQAAAEALTTAMGQAEVRRVLETETHTALMDAFNRGGRDELVENSHVVPLTVLSEIRDRRTRGNPRGLYPDAGPHYQMDGFVAETSDPIWDRITPPNGWRCRGTVRGMSVSEARRRRYIVEQGDALAIDRETLRRRHERQWALIESGQYPDDGFS